MPIQSRNKRRRRYSAPIGGIFVLLALVGIVTVITSSIRLTYRVLDNESEKERFAEIIRPVAMFDPSPFEDPRNLDMLSLLRYAMWGTIKSDKLASYPYDENSELIIPASDLDVTIGRLFGTDIKLIHQSFGDGDAVYRYVDKDGVYHVPPSVQLLVYRPVVLDITKEGEFYNLYVGYVPPETAWTDASGPRPEKYMIYVMSRSGDNYYIAKVQSAPDSQTVLDGQAAQQQQKQKQK